MNPINLPLSSFKNPEISKEDEPELVYISKLDISENGIFTWIKGSKYPMKGYPSAYRYLEGNSNTFDFVVDRIEIVKNALWLKARSFANWRGIIALINWKNFLREAVHFADRVLYRFYLKPELYCRSGKEVYRMGKVITEGKDPIYRKMVDFVCMIWEFDDAYRYRFQDAFGTSKNVKKGIKLLLERDEKGRQEKKWLLIKFLYGFLMIFPSLKKIVRIIEKETNWHEIELDESDKFWSYRKKSYKFDGLNYEERLKLRENL